MLYRVRIVEPGMPSSVLTVFCQTSLVDPASRALNKRSLFEVNLVAIRFNTCNHDYHVLFKNDIDTLDEETAHSSKL